MLFRFQIKCGYCGKSLSQDEERKLGEISLCEDCFRFIVGVYSLAVSPAHSNALSSAFSERKRALSQPLSINISLSSSL